jgi:hypothetical protein
MEYKWKIGDEFKFRQFGRNRNKACRYPNKTFIIKELDSYSVKYEDNRTNVKCKCSYCRGWSYLRWNYSTNGYEETGLKSELIDNIILVRTKEERTRDIALKILNI